VGEVRKRNAALGGYRLVKLGPVKLDDRQKYGVMHYYAQLVDNNKYAARTTPYPCFKEEVK
jgi:hypothetical protein